MASTSASNTAQSTLELKDQVIAAVDLPRVPCGTAGKVIFVEGLEWIRYWVLFENGQRLGTINRKKLMTFQEWDRRNDAPSAAVSKSSQSAGDGASPAAAEERIGGVPVHLLERSKAARARWAAKNS